MENLLNTKNKYPIFIIAIVLIAIIIFPFVENYINNKVNDIRPMADSLMYNLKNQKFDNINNVLNKDIDVKKLATGDNIIDSYKVSGYGVDAPDDIWISYYVVGLPAETRNININFIKKEGKWFIKDIVPAYQISRTHKKNILFFIDRIISDNYISAQEVLENNIGTDKFDAIKEFINKNSNSINDWQITKAKNYPTPHLKNKTPSKTEFFVKSMNNNKKSLYFLCKNLKNKYWIDKIKIINNE